jgi:hypothetical protein
MFTQLSALECARTYYDDKRLISKTLLAARDQESLSRSGVFGMLNPCNDATEAALTVFRGTSITGSSCNEARFG